MHRDDEIQVALLAHKAELLGEGGDAIGITRCEIGEATLFVCERWPTDIGFNRAYGVNAQDLRSLATIAGIFHERSLRPLLEIIPASLDATARSELSRLGMQPLWEVMALTGGYSRMPAAGSADVAVRQVEATEAASFALLAVEAYGFAPTVATQQRQLWAALCRDNRSQCLIAEIAGWPCAVGILSVIDRVAVMNGAATQREFRQRGCQRALLSGRMALAHKMGIHNFFVRTMVGSDSQRNLEYVGLGASQLRSIWGHPLSA